MKNKWLEKESHGLCRVIKIISNYVSSPDKNGVMRTEIRVNPPKNRIKY